MGRDPRCEHVPTSPGQSVCECLDELMWLRAAFEGACRRVVQLEAEVQTHPPHVFTPDDLTRALPSDHG